MATAVEHASIGTLDPRELDAVAELWALAFGRSIASLRRKLAAIDVECVRVLRENDRVQGCVVVRTRRIAFGGAWIPTVCLSSLAVRPEVRRRGHGSALVAHALASARESNTPLAVLHANDTRLYESAGFVRIGTRWLCRFPPRALRFREARGDVRSATDSDHGAIHALHVDEARRHNGHVAFDAREIRAQRRTPRQTFVHVVDDRIDGFAVLGQRDEGGARNLAYVHRFVARDDDAAAALCARIRAETSASAEVRWHRAPLDPHSERLDERLAHHEELEATMACIVDPEVALAARGFPIDRNAGVTLEIANRGFRLDVTNGRATVSTCDRASVQLSEHALVRLFTSNSSAAELRERGEIAGDAASIAILDRLFAGATPSLQDLV